MKGQYTITLSDNTQIQLCFKSFAITRFAELSGGLSYSEVIQLFASGNLSLRHMINLLLSGAEYVCLKDNKPFQYNELDAADWIDDMGGIFSVKLQEVLQVVIKSLTPDSEPTEETGKKKVTKA